MRKLLVPFKPPKPKEQADNLLRWIGSTLKKPDEQASKHYSHLISVVGAVDASNINYIANYLHKQEYIIIQTSSNNALFANMTFKGWDRFDELEKSSKDSRLAFMAMKFGNVTLDKIFSTVIKDVVAKTGFEIRRLDEEKRAGLIDDKLRVEIRRSKFLIADLTDNNNGAYWEAGYAEGLGMPVIYVCEESKFNTDKPHFDTNHHLTVLWKDDVESLRIFADELKATIRATLLSDAKMED
ncbi:MAG: hypothetical protein P4L35_11225 [Ignavibacteriaceae bacterium]|nr:hypothetical protein [Ignavibacteriaceae bacterium]